MFIATSTTPKTKVDVTTNNPKIDVNELTLKIYDLVKKP